MDASLAGIGHRIYEVRRALGPDPRHEMPQRAFARLLNETAARLYPNPADRQGDYDSSVIARLEKGERRVTVQDVTVVTVVDPLRRGLLWLCWDEAVDTTMHAPRRQGPSVIQEPPSDTFDQEIPRRKPGQRPA